MKKLVAILLATLFALPLCTFFVSADANDDYAQLEAAKGDIIYENNFDAADSLNDFTQYRGNWVIKDGKCYLHEITKANKDDLTAKEQHSFLIMSKNGGIKDADYIAEIDMYNIQSQGGLITHANVEAASDTDSNAFYGFLNFVSFDGTKAAIGSTAKSSGAWAGNMWVSGGILKPGMNIRLTVKMEGLDIIYGIKDLDTGNIVMVQKQEAIAKDGSLFEKGSVGMRLCNYSGSNVNLDNTGFDNLKVYTIKQVETEKSTEQATEKATEQTTEKTTEKATEKVTEKATEKVTEKATDNATEKAATTESGAPSWLIPVIIAAVVVAAGAVAVIVILKKKKA